METDYRNLLAKRFSDKETDDYEEKSISLHAMVTSALSTIKSYISAAEETSGDFL